MPDRDKVIAQCEWVIKQTSPTIIESKTFYEEVLALLKEQEAVKPEWKDGIPFCGNCGHRLEKKSRNTDGIKCPKCERTVKWG